MICPMTDGRVAGAYHQILGRLNGWPVRKAWLSRRDKAAAAFGILKPFGRPKRRWYVPSRSWFLFPLFFLFCLIYGFAFALLAPCNRGAVRRSDHISPVADHLGHAGRHCACQDNEFFLFCLLHRHDRLAELHLDRAAGPAMDLHQTPDSVPACSSAALRHFGFARISENTAFSAAERSRDLERDDCTRHH